MLQRLNRHLQFLPTFSPQKRIDLAAEQLRLMLTSFAWNQQELYCIIDWTKHSAKAYEAWCEGKPVEMLIELYHADQSRNN